MALGGRLTREAAIYAAGLGASAFLQFLAVPVYTRSLGPETYSLIPLTLAVSGAFSGVLLVGGDVVLSRFWFDVLGAARRSLTLTWILFLLAWSIVGAAIAVLLVPVVVAWFPDSADLTTPLILAITALVPAQASRMLAQVLRNSFRPVAMAATGVFIGAISVGIGLFLAVHLGWGVPGVFWGLVAGELAGCLVRVPLVMPDLKGHFTPSLLPPLLRFGLPFIPATIAVWAFTGTDRIAVGSILGVASLGGYSVATTLVLPFTLLVVALGQAWIPRIVDLYERAPSDALRTGATALEASLLVFGSAAMALTAVAPLAVSLLGGPGYESGAAALPLLALGGAFQGTTLFAATGYTLAKRSGLVPVITLAAAAVNIVLLAILVPAWGIVGAASAVAASYWVLTAGMLCYSQAHLRMPIRWGPLASAASIITAVVVWATLQPGNGLIAPVCVLVASGLLTRAWWLLQGRTESATTAQPTP